MWNITLENCTILHISHLKLDSKQRSKYPETNMCQNKQKEDDELQLLEQKYEEILTNDPKSNTFCQLADVLHKQGKEDKAIGVLIRGLSHNKNNVTARFMLGNIYYDRWLIEQAKKEMEAVLEITPDNLDAAKLLAEIYNSEDKQDKALSILEGLYVFHRNDSGLLDEINKIKNIVSEKERQLSSKAFETPIESRKLHKIGIDKSTENNEVYTETMFNLYLEQGLYEQARKMVDKIYSDELQKKSAIEKLEKTKLNKMNHSAGFSTGD